MHVVIIGAGPGGYVAAIRAAQRGANVTVVEKGALGGVCLQWGCIPSKALLACANLFTVFQRAEEFGIHAQGQLSANFQKIISRKDAIVNNLSGGILSLFKSWGVSLYEGEARFLDHRTIRIYRDGGKDTVLTADAIIIATGSRASTIPILVPDGKTILTSKEILELKELPKEILIVGGGIEGCEFATLFSSLGIKVVLVELASRILSSEDKEIAIQVQKQFKKQGIDFYFEKNIVDVEKLNGKVSATLSGGEVVQADKVLVSIGRHVDTDGLGLENAGINLEKSGAIIVNEYLETTSSGIYAIGDVIGKSMLAHAASHHGKIAVENIMGNPVKTEDNIIPAGIFTVPEIGRVGITEEQARFQSMQIRIGKFRAMALGKAHADGHCAGLFKVIADAETDRILGVHIVGEHAADLIHEAAIAMQLGGTAKALANTIHAHPTWSEGLMEAAEDVHGDAIHLPRKRRPASTVQ